MTIIFFAGVIFPLSTIKARGQSFYAADSFVDTTVMVAPGFASLIYVNNKVYASDTIVLKWRIDSVVHNMSPTLQDGICTHVCYPTSKREGIEDIYPSSPLPLKAYFVDPNGITDTGTARMYVTVFDTADSQNTLTRLVYTLHILLDTTSDTPATLEIVGEHETASCLRRVFVLEGWLVVNGCNLSLPVRVVDVGGQVVGEYVIAPGFQLRLPAQPFRRVFIVSDYR